MRKWYSFSYRFPNVDQLEHMSGTVNTDQGLVRLQEQGGKHLYIYRTRKRGARTDPAVATQTCYPKISFLCGGDSAVDDEEAWARARRFTVSERSGCGLHRRAERVAL